MQCSDLYATTRSRRHKKKIKTSYYTQYINNAENFFCKRGSLVRNQINGQKSIVTKYFLRNRNLSSCTDFLNSSSSFFFKHVNLVLHIIRKSKLTIIMDPQVSADEAREFMI